MLAEASRFSTNLHVETSELGLTAALEIHCYSTLFLQENGITGRKRREETNMVLLSHPKSSQEASFSFAWVRRTSTFFLFL